MSTEIRSLRRSKQLICGVGEDSLCMKCAALVRLKKILLLHTFKESNKLWIDRNRQDHKGRVVEWQLSRGVNSNPKQFIVGKIAKPRSDRELMSLIIKDPVAEPKSLRHGLTLPAKKLFITQEDRTNHRRKRNIDEGNCIRLGVGRS